MLTRPWALVMTELRSRMMRWVERRLSQAEPFAQFFPGVAELTAGDGAIAVGVEIVEQAIGGGACRTAGASAIRSGAIRTFAIRAAAVIAVIASRWAAIIAVRTAGSIAIGAAPLIAVRATGGVAIGSGGTGSTGTARRLRHGGGGEPDS